MQPSLNASGSFLEAQDGVSTMDSRHRRPSFPLTKRKAGWERSLGMGPVLAGCFKRERDTAGLPEQHFRPVSFSLLGIQRWPGTCCSIRSVCTSGGSQPGRLVKRLSLSLLSTTGACSRLTSVGAVLALYKAGGGPGTDPALPQAHSVYPEGQRLQLHLAPALRSLTPCEWLLPSAQTPWAPVHAQTTGSGPPGGRQGDGEQEEEVDRAVARAGAVTGGKLCALGSSPR